MPKHLLIVESPAKAKTINKYLGKDFTVLASYGHVRDLVPKEGAVDPDNGFAMRYDLIEKNEKHVEAIARAAKGADDIFLATDPDREGEAISWHIAEILKERGLLKDKPMQRVVFTEITPRAIKEAMLKPRAIAADLVDAQQARRALDYLVGFNLSPVLWRKVQRGLSAGRVQSPALRMIVEREEEIEAFIPREYWSIDAHCRHPSQAFNARLIKLDGQKFEQFTVTDGDTAEAARLRIQQAAQGVLHVTDVASKERKRRPAPPFTTSTLQQEASRKLGFTTRKTMQVAQKLYEGVALGDEGSVGLISYMRTDSVNLSQDALAEIRDVIARDFGTASLPDQPNAYTTKSKNAQEAHEAVRPTSALRTPAQVARFLSDDERRLYELIWRRAVACQMIPATLNTVSVDLSAGSEHVFRASGTTVVVPGFLAVYEEGKDTKSSEDEDEGRKLPLMKAGDNIPLDRIVTDQHFTQPPPRFTEAALVKALEEYGIGRPSTYASIIQTLQFRKYVEMEGRSFRPTDVGRAVSKFLSGHFTRYVDYDFTANLEDDLDAVSRGEAEWIPLMEKFWGPFKELVEDKKDSLDKTDAGSVRVLGTDPVSGKEVSARIGRFGPMVQIGTVEDEDKPTFASLRPGQSIYSISIEDALELFKMPRALGQDKDQDVSVGIGRFGPFARRGSVYASLKKEDDPYTIDLARAVFLIEEKEEIARNRVIKNFEGSDIQVLNGRFGPYISDGKLNGKIPKDREPASLTFEEVQQLLADTGKPVRKGFGAKKATLKKNTVKDSSPKQPAVKKTATKTAASKTTAKKAPAKRAAAKKATKRVVKKTVSKAAN
ncbi:DNA topoisomerase I [Xanthomonas vasicola]|uniref:DNA topoisomerase I n=1 Tax=Xanthomonas vasicola TaxID=56459 RepID=UPI0001CC0491|nr:DNA topoisomerase I [Xanthomonas vasicola]KFA26239.1 DNA topoisomerase I [Xanthomonas vasicola pv. musacearum NCPPB 4384]AZR32614.1 DNA topoisomerase I [Xanthomonas vasicola pv. musacearum NCPPB 4379]KFA04360.1 DNA topoisomerase I [Xanthomonas vasicola pv. musacearum NCPPB 4380]KFA12414.1 DNA topoisomerase I [Xanthomonas vasicola pv. musacearum NCPPB 2005]KFA18521.1 DNA topoisomerase I [Xanthomonas vasicola pv. musacearum NCPPB 4392]